MSDALFGWNPPLALALFALVSVQLLKFFGTLIVLKRLDLRRLIGTGGMPSSHAASASALATAVGLQVGWGSPLFAVAAYFALVVLYDATGIRRAAGRQAAVLNRMIEDLREHHTIEGERLLELLGHTPLEVLAGTTYGILVALALSP
ncbi:MAG TPA: divergent PAP2 family protein [Longimicrobiales bacterium]|nr:divergent PAP2 family protein [Longimicrobiales bacterium]